ncbi:MAG: 4Fe-4S dicluster domain-containing protein [Anaerolineales bacterium]|jgi:polyferredoxin
MDTPVGNPKKRQKKLRKGQVSGQWITFRKTVQYLALFAFFALFVWSTQGGGAGDLINIPMRLDPLLILANLLASRVFLAGSSLALIVLLLTLVFGRAWCGWLCPLGTILDLFPLDRGRKGRPAPSDGWRRVKFDLVIVICVAALLGNLTLLFFDPLALLQRTLTVSLWPALDRIVTALEAALVNVPFLADPLSTFDGWIRPAVLPLQPVFYTAGLFYAAVFLGVILLNMLAARFWCRYLCPLGGGLGLLSKLAVFRRQVGTDCKGCTLCTDICPTGTIDPAKDYASDPSECTLCLDCLEVCPRGLTRFVPAFSLGKRMAYDPGRRDVLLGVGATIAAVALFKTDSLAKRQSAWLIRPPGVRETNSDLAAFTKCTRCNECIRVCPTGGLQPSVFEAGLEGLGAPILVPRLGYCDYSCNACGQACPVQAIPPLSLDQKRQQVIGLAYINQNRCIPWSDHQPCLVCQEMCPVPQKAIQLEQANVWGPDGTQVAIQLPHVLRDLCIGCGICEYKCPVSGEAAIRVYMPKVEVPF